MYKGVFSVIIIRVDDGKGLLNEALAGQDSLSRSPGLLPPFRQGDALRQIVQRLKGIPDLHTQLGADRFDTVADDFPEVRFDLFADDKNDLTKTCPDGIVDGIIHDDLTMKANRLQLFDAGAISGTNAGGHHNKCLFHAVLLLKHQRTRCVPCGYGLPRLCGSVIYSFTPSSFK